ncbi:hypothetical protein BgiBS90_012924, partial [Biomphalaria glabrata]
MKFIKCIANNAFQTTNTTRLSYLSMASTNFLPCGQLSERDFLPMIPNSPVLSHNHHET